MVRWLNVDELAEVLGLHPKTVRKMIDRGTIPANRTGDSIRIRVNADDLDKLMRPIPADDRGAAS